AYTNERVAGVFSHPLGGEVEIEWTIAQAKAAGLTGKEVWRQYPRAMLRARVISEGIRTVFPGVAVGVYTPEEIGDLPIGAASPTGPREIDMGNVKVVASDTPDASDELLAAAEAAAKDGLGAYQAFWKSLDPADRKAIGPTRHESYKAMAMQAPDAAEAA
ncbi:MAG: hypothetical protein VKL39_24605, partial [Leptolyngbyaceae bacterium]|nr:hypothetical protein [Leptolyngbyaceae bacterium]